MPKICYIPKEFKAPSLYLINRANEIIHGYSLQGFRLTLRQLYYKFVSSNLFPEDRKWRWVERSRRWAKDSHGTKNADPNYKWLGSVINDARLAGLIDWDSIEDRTRNVAKQPHWCGPEDIVNACADQFSTDHWEDQENYVEVWIEKDALSGIFFPICTRLDVPLFSCRGYSSQSEMWSAGSRLTSKIAAGKRAIILHFGDHDPSGLDMTRDIEHRLRLFISGNLVAPNMFSGRFELRRIALNMSQVNEYGPPPNPAKITDSRYIGYRSEFGDDCWEIDALEPQVLVNLVRENVMMYVNQDTYNAKVTEGARGRDLLRDVSDNWEAIVDFLTRNSMTTE